jgi:NAD(P)-dependent dehydrogenase (short-subunit alcohol dehydrogenase family)
MSQEPKPRTDTTERRFVGKAVLVTGAGTGFGAELAVRAAREGARVVGVHYNSSAAGAEATALRVREQGSEAIIVQADIRDWSAIKAMADKMFGAAGTLDVLINNVGDVATDQMSWKDLHEESIDRVLDVDIKGTMFMIHEFGTRMLEQGHGAIVNIASTVIVRGSPRAPIYAAAKYGILGLTKSYAGALAPTVRVNAFAPGFMETAATLAREDWKTGRKERLISMTPAKHIPLPEELAPAALFLASDDAAHMYGAFIVCDGGYNMIGA